MWGRVPRAGEFRQGVRRLCFFRLSSWPSPNLLEPVTLAGARPDGGSPLTRQIRQRGVITGLGATTAWLIGSLTPGSARRTGTMALCGVVGAPLPQTLAGREHSPLVLATTLGSAAVLVGIVQTPLLSHFFGCTPLGPVAWTGVGAAITVAAVSPWALDTAERLLPDALARLRSDLRTAT